MSTFEIYQILCVHIEKWEQDTMASPSSQSVNVSSWHTVRRIWSTSLLVVTAQLLLYTSHWQANQHTQGLVTSSLYQCRQQQTMNHVGD